MTAVHPQPNPNPKPDPKPEKPQHQHDWQPVYKDHPAQAAQGYYNEIPAVTKQVYYIYFGNGHKVTEQDVINGFDIDEYAAKNNTNWWDGYETVVVTPARKEWVETTPAKPAWRELVGYKCSCGATKAN